MTGKYDLLKERALNNFELLLNKWKINYIKIGENEYDFLSPTRPNDSSFGACRFNIVKGVGADFAASNLTRQDYERVGIGFDKSDFHGFSQYGETRNSFDIIGLTQRIQNISSYKEAAKRLDNELQEIDGSGAVGKLYEQIAKRHALIEARKGKSLFSAAKTWSMCSDINGTIGEKYLNSRGIHGPFNEPNMKFHRAVYNKELNLFIPAVLFRISKFQHGPLCGIHRIWIAKDGSRKARLQEPKKAIGQVHGNGIWLGELNEVLIVCEGPEEALTFRSLGYPFVVSTVYATNYHSLDIPYEVKKVILLHDSDAAGLAATEKAEKEYIKQGKIVICRGTDGKR